MRRVLLGVTASAVLTAGVLTAVEPTGSGSRAAGASVPTTVRCVGGAA